MSVFGILLPNECGQSSFEKLSRSLRFLAGLSPLEVPVGESLLQDGAPEETTHQDSFALSKSVGVTVVINEGGERGANNVFKRSTTEADFDPKDLLDDVVFLMNLCQPRLKTGCDDSLFHTSLCVVTLLYLDRIVPRLSNLTEIQDVHKTSKACLEYLGSIFKSKKRSKEASISAGFLRSDFFLVLCELAVGDVTYDAKPQIPEVWEDMFHAPKEDVECCLMNQSLKLCAKETFEDETKLRELKMQLRDIMKDKTDSKKLPARINELFQSLLRTQRVPIDLMEKCERNDNDTSAKNDSLTSNDLMLISAKTRIQQRLKASLSVELLDRDSLANPRKLYYKNNETVIVNPEFLQTLVDVTSEMKSLGKLKLCFDSLKPTGPKGVLDALSFDSCKNVGGLEVFSSILDELKLFISVLNFASKFQMLPQSQAKMIVKMSIEYVAASLVTILCHVVINTTGHGKRDSFHGEDENLSTVQEIVPLLERLIQSVADLFNSQWKELGSLYEVMVSWLMISFLHGLSKSQYSVSMDRQQSMTKSLLSKRSYSRSYSFRSGPSSGVLTTAILSIVTHVFTLLPKVMENAELTSFEDQLPNPSLFINALFKQVNLTSLSFWLLNVLLKRAIALRPAKAATEEAKQEWKSQKSDGMKGTTDVVFSDMLTSEMLINQSSTGDYSDLSNSDSVAVRQSQNIENLAISEAASVAQSSMSIGLSVLAMNAENLQQVAAASAQNAEGGQTSASNEGASASNHMYRRLPGDSETDNSSTTGGNSLFEEAMMIDEDEEEAGEAEEDDEEEEIVHAEEDEDDDIEWTEEGDEEEDEDDVEEEEEDEMSNAVVDDDDLSNTVSGVNELPAPLTVDMPSADASPNEHSGPPPNEDDDFCLDHFGGEAVLGLLFNEDADDGVAGKKTKEKEAKDVVEWSKSEVYVNACTLILEMIKQNGLKQGTVFNSNLAHFFSQQQCTTMASIIKELSAPPFDLPPNLETLRRLVFEVAHSLFELPFCASIDNLRPFFQELGLDWTSCTDNSWPLTVPTPCLSLLANVLIFKEGSSNVILQIWKRVLEVIQQKIVSSSAAKGNQAVGSSVRTAGVAAFHSEDLSQFMFQLLQFTFFSLSRDQKLSLVSQIMKTVVKCSTICVSDNNVVFIARLFNVTEFVLNYFSVAPPNLSRQIETNFFSTFDFDSQVELLRSPFVDSGPFSCPSKQETTHADEVSVPMRFRDLQMKFYEVTPNSDSSSLKQTPVPRINKDGFNALVEVCKKEINYDTFYDSLIKYLVFATPEKEECNFFVSQTYSYTFSLQLKLISILPPSPAFIEKLANPVMLPEGATKMQLVLQVMWACRLSWESYGQYVRHVMEKLDASQNVSQFLDRFADESASLYKMSELLNVFQAKFSDSIVKQSGNMHSFVPSHEELLVVDTIASRLYSSLQLACKRDGFNLLVIESALPGLQNLLKCFQHIARNAVLNRLQSSLNCSAREVYDLALRCNFANKHIKAAVKNVETMSTADVNLLDLVLENAESSSLKNSLSVWKEETSKNFGLFPEFDSFNSEAASKLQENSSEMYASHVMLAHLRCVVTEAPDRRTLQCLQHTCATLTKLYCGVVDWSDSHFLSQLTEEPVPQTCVELLLDDTLVLKDELASCLEQLSEKIYKKPLSSSPVQEVVVQKMIAICYDMLFLVVQDETVSALSLSDSVFKNCLALIQKSLFTTEPLVSKVVLSVLGSESRSLAKLVSLLGMRGELSVNKLTALLEMISMLMKEESLSKKISSLQRSWQTCHQFSFQEVHPILKFLFVKTEDSNGVPALYHNEEVFKLVAIIARFVADGSVCFISSSLPEEILKFLMSLSKDLIHRPDQSKQFESILSIMLILADHRQGAGHVKLFQSCVNLLPLLVDSISCKCKRGEQFDNRSELAMFNCVVGYLCEVLLLLRSESADLESEELSRNATSTKKPSPSPNLLQPESRGASASIGELSEELTEEDASAGGESSQQKLCTFTVTQKEFMNQHWYHCYTCSMHDSVGVCSICAKLCHKDHDVTYAKFGSFYCDCGAKGESYCKALSATSIEKLLSEQSAEKAASGGEKSRGSKLMTTVTLPGAKRKEQYSKLDAASAMCGGKASWIFDVGSEKLSLLEIHKEELLKTVQDSNIGQVVELLNGMRSYIESHARDTSPANASMRLSRSFDILHGSAAKKVSVVDNLVNLVGTSSENAFENVKMSFSGEHGATMRQLITAHMVKRGALTLMPTLSTLSSGGGGNMLVVAHDKGLLTCVDSAMLLKQINVPPEESASTASAKKLNIDRLPYNTVPITILSVASNNLNPGCLALAGIKDCYVVVLKPDHSISNQNNLNLALDAGNFVIKALWIPGSLTELAIVTADFVKIFNLAQDAQNPVYFYHLLSGKLRDVTFLADTTGNCSTVHALIMSSQGFIYTQVLDKQSKAEDGGGGGGPFYVTNTLVIESAELKLTNGQFGSGGLSVFYSHSMQMLFCSYSNAKSFACSLKKLEELPTSTVLNKLQLLTNTSSLCQWKETEEHPGLILASDQSSGNIFVLFMSPDTFYIEEITLSPARCKAVDAVALAPAHNSNSSSSRSTSVFVLTEDGSLKAFSVNSSLTDFWISPTFSASSFSVHRGISDRKKTKPANWKSKVRSGGADAAAGSVQMTSPTSPVDFPIDYFEHCQVMEDVEFGGNDYLQVYNRKQMKSRLKHVRQFLAATKSSPIKMEITNDNSQLLIAGLRVEVGGNQIGNADWTPSYFEIFGRQVCLDPVSTSRWVDLPFTNEECLKSDKSVTLTIGNSRDTSSGITIVNSVKVYGKCRTSFAALHASQNSTEAAEKHENMKKIKDANELLFIIGHRRFLQDRLMSSDVGLEPQFDLFLSHSLEIIASYFSVSGVDFKSKSAKEAMDLCRSLAACPLSPAVYSQNKNVLFSIIQSKDKLYAELDEINLNSVAKVFQSGSPELSPEAFDRHLETIKIIAQHRPRNLVKYSFYLTKVLVTSNQGPTENSGTAERMSTLVEDIMSMFWSVVEERCNVKLLVPLVNQTKVKNEKLVTSVVEILFAYAVQEKEFMPQMMTHLVSLLLYHDPAISSVAKSVLNRVARTSKASPRTSFYIKSVPQSEKPSQTPLPLNVLTASSGAVGLNPVSLSDSNVVQTGSDAYENTQEPLNALAMPAVDVEPEQNALRFNEQFENIDPMPAPASDDVPQNTLDVLLNAAAPLLELPHDADDEAMMELAIALSLQEQPGSAGNPPAHLFGQEPVDVTIEDASASAAVIGSPPTNSSTLAQVEPPHVEFAETPDVSNVQGSSDSTDDTASAGETDDYDDEEEESIAATDGSALVAESLPPTVGSGAASEDGNSLAGESMQTTASASSSAYGGEEGVYANVSRSVVVTPKSLNQASSSTSIVGSTEAGLNSSFVHDDSVTSKLADSRVEMLKLMMTYFPQVCNVGGIRAIPFLQVFLSLSLEIEDEKIIAEILDHIMEQLKLKADQSITRTFSKEVQVLLLRLLSMYMQKNVKGEETSLLSKMTAQVLYERGVVDYCRDVVTEMLPYWQNSFNHVESQDSCKLLKVQPTRCVPDMHPFFLANYVLEHQTDVFEAYHQLVTEVSLRIPYQVYRILDTAVQPVFESIKSQWITPLSHYMILPSQYVRHQVRKLLQFVCGTKEQYRLQRDLYVFKHHFDTIQLILFSSCNKIVNDDEDNQEQFENEDSATVPPALITTPFQPETSFLFPENLSTLHYTVLITVVENLKQVLEAATGRCFSWFKFCESNPTVILFLMKLAPFTDDTIRQYIIELIALATCGSKTTATIKSKAGVSERPRKSGASVATSQNIREKIATDEEVSSAAPECSEATCAELADGLIASHVPEFEWHIFLRIFFLECSSVPLRWQLHGLMCSFWKRISDGSREKILDILWDLWSEAPLFGKRASQLVDALGILSLSAGLPVEKLKKYANGLAGMMRTQNELLERHQNFALYEKLLRLVEVDGFYLESDACLICHGKESSSSSIKLSSIKADSRFTTTTQIIKLISPHQISGITCRISDINNTKMVKSMAIYYNKRTVASVVELKNNPHIWHRARKVNLEAGQSEIKIEFALPVVATNIMMEVCDFYENFHAATESLQCPRCSSSVMANPGICGNCGENVFQCHKCRQINYDEKDPFLCSSCGFCKYAKFEFTLNAKACVSAIDPIENQDDRKKAIANLNSLLENADNLTRSIQCQKPLLEELLQKMYDRNEGAIEPPRPYESFANVHPHPSNPSTPTGAAAAFAVSANAFVHREIQAIAKKYYVSKMSFDELTVTAEKIIATRSELLDYDRRHNLVTVYSDSFSTGGKHGNSKRGKEKRTAATSKSCFGCVVHSSIHCVYLLKAFAAVQELKWEIGKPILDCLVVGSNLRRVCDRVQGLINELIEQVCHNKEELTASFCQTLLTNVMKTVENSTKSVHSSEVVSSKLLHDQVALLLGKIDTRKDLCWSIRVKTVSQLLFLAVRSKNPAVICHVVLPCMKFFLNMICRDNVKFEAPNVAKIDKKIDLNSWFTSGLSLDGWKRFESDETAKPLMSQNSWMRVTLFHPSSKAVRQCSCSILEELAANSEQRCEAILKLLIKYIEESCCMNYGQDLTEAMALVQKLTNKDDRKKFMSNQGVPKRIAELILCEIDRFTEKEYESGDAPMLGRASESVLGVSASWSHDMCQGVRLRCLTELLSGLLDVSEILNNWKAQLIQPILHGYLAIKKLVSQRTKAIDETQEVLLEMLDLMTTGNVDETKEFMKICVATLQQFPAEDQLTPVFVFERLCNLIHPEQPDTTPDFSLCLEKDPQQEDFLAGRMQGNPYSCSEPGIGPLMRDVKNKICRDCELVALLEDDNGMELLVNNRIISLSLPVAEVYQKVWLAPERGGNPQNEGEPMRVVYRMRGLMGDATEEFIENLNSRSANDSSAGQDATEDEEKEEELYKLASVLAECQGFQVMLSSLRCVSDVFASRHLVYVLLKLFSYAVKVRSNRLALVNPEYDTLNIFLRLLQLVLNMPESGSLGSSMSHTSSNKDACTTRNELVEKVLLVMQPILQETQHSKSVTGTALKITGGDLAQLEQILSCMNISHIQQNPVLLQNLMTIVPYLAFGDTNMAKNVLVEFFKPFIDFEKYNEEKSCNAVASTKTEIFIDCFTAMVESIPSSSDGNDLKSCIAQSGVLSSCVNYVLNLTPDKEYLTDQKAWNEFLARPAVPYVLKLMRALSKNHEETQIMISESCIPVLHRLERVASAEQVGTLAENLLDTLKENAQVSKMISGARKQTRQEKKRLAMAMRAKQLETLGLEATAGGRVVKTSSHNTPNFEDLADESGPVCCICREGYKYHPKSVMGIYVFAKKHPMEPFETYMTAASSQRAAAVPHPFGAGLSRVGLMQKCQGYTTVSSFNTVHFDCHNNAVRSHRGRDEWESATLQNADVKCNAIMPMWASQITESQFAHALSKFNTHIQECTGFREPNYQSTVHDCKLLLLKFAEEKSFSEDCGGGARQSNAKLIPFHFTIALYVMNSTRNAAREEALLLQYLQEPASKWPKNAFEVDGVHLYAVMQLLIMKQSAFWDKHKLHFLKRLVACAHVRHLFPSGISQSGAEMDSSEKDYKVYKSAIMYFTCIHILAKLIKKQTIPSVNRTWAEDLAEYLKQNGVAFLELLDKKFVSEFEEALTAESFAEWCDIVGLLPEIESPDNANNFIQNILTSLNTSESAIQP